MLAACGADAASPDAGTAPDAGRGDAGSRAVDAGDAGGDATGDAGVPPDAGPPRAPLDGNRDRLLALYLEHLRAHPDQTQSNGLRGSELAGVCELWARLDPSARAVFLTITHRLQGSTLGSDRSPMLDHVTALYRVVGGAGATATDRGSCGGGEANRMFLSIDAPLHEALSLAHADERAADGSFVLADVPSDGYWRASNDVAGPHAPFDRSDETQAGAPRAQAHFFADPTSSRARSALGRTDLESLVDPRALEIDHDFDCIHDSNPLCDYTFYGPACAPQTRRQGLEIYERNYGSVERDWAPAGCGDGAR